MARKHGVTEHTYKRFAIDSGAVYKNYGESDETLLGATRGGTSCVIESEYRHMPVDGAKGPVKGDMRLISVNAVLTANFVELSTEIFQRILPGSSVADYGSPKTHDEITRAIQIALTDYATNVALCGEVTGAGANAFEFILDNAIVDGNFEAAMADAEEVVLSVAFKGHFDPASMDAEPWTIRWPEVPTT